jgi:hypothetical protein
MAAAAYASRFSVVFRVFLFALFARGLFGLFARCREFFRRLRGGGH